MDKQQKWFFCGEAVSRGLIKEACFVSNDWDFFWTTTWLVVAPPETLAELQSLTETDGKHRCELLQNGTKKSGAGMVVRRCVSSSGANIHPSVAPTPTDNPSPLPLPPPHPSPPRRPLKPETLYGYLTLSWNPPVLNLHIQNRLLSSGPPVSLRTCSALFDKVNPHITFPLISTCIGFSSKKQDRKNNS